MQFGGIGFEGNFSNSITLGSSIHWDTEAERHTPASP